MNAEKPEDLLYLPRLHWAVQTRHDYKGSELNATARESLLFYVEQGHLEFQLTGKTLNAEAGTLIILSQGISYNWHWQAGTQILLVFFASCRFEFDDTPRVMPLPDGDCASRWMRDLIALQAQGNRQRDITDHLLAALLSRIKQIEGRESSLRELHPAVAATVQWIDDHIAESATLEELALHAHCSASHLRALFKQQVGSGVLRYQQDRRMQYALQWLEQPHLTLGEVARRCGYQDVEYFSRLFQRYHQMSPGRWRRMKR